jgi:hypothetical protein
MSKQDQGSLIGPSTSRQALLRGLQSKGGAVKRVHNKTQSSEVGDLKLKIRALQRELAKVRMAVPPAKVGNHPGQGAQLHVASKSTTPKVSIVSSTSTTSSYTPTKQLQLPTQQNGLKNLPQQQVAKVVSPPARPVPEHRKVGPMKSSVWSAKLRQEGRRVPYATHGSQQQQVGPDATIAVARQSVTSGTSSIVTGVTGRQELSPLMHRHKCRFTRKDGNPCNRFYAHEHKHYKLDHDQHIGDCPYKDCQNHNAKKVADNHGEPCEETGLDVLASVASKVKPVRFLAPHNTGVSETRDDDPEVVKPIKSGNSERIDTMKNRGDFLQKVRRPQRVAPHYANCDLVHLLRLEYAFKPRTSNMLSQMAAKSRIYLSRYDCSDLTAKEQYNLIISAVSAAMEISPLEEQVRQSLRNSEGNQARHKQARMIREGILGNKLFGSPDKLPSNK